jgi:hypothetical protein
MLRFLKIFVFFCFFLNVPDVFSQEQKSFMYYDSTTYQQYQKNDWNNLIKISRKAYKNNIDYYYLRMRTGIAYFEKHNYILARKHFMIAAELNSLDPLSREYIYYCFLYSGREKEATLYFIQNKHLLENKVHDKINPVKKISVDIAYHSNLEENKTLFNGENISDENNVLLDGFQIITRHFLYSGFSLQHGLSKNLDLIHGGSLLQKYNYYYSQTDGIAFDTYEHKIYQSQYYAALKIFPGDGFQISPSFHYLYLASPKITFKERGSGTAYTVPANYFNYYSARISASQSFGLISLNAGTSISNYNENRQIQKDLTLSFFPFGNLNLYSLSTLYKVTEEYRNNKVENRMVFREIIGFKANPKLWIEAGAIIGDIKNMNTDEGYIIYNGNETISGKYHLSFFIPLEKMSLSLRTIYQQYYTTFFDPLGNDLGINKLTFNGYSLIGGLTWNF